MVTFLFWNLARRDIPDVVAGLVLEHNVDVVLLAENVTQRGRLLEKLNASDRPRYHFAPSWSQTKVDIFSTFLPQFIKPHADEHRASLRKIQLPGCPEILLCAIHLPSRAAWEEADLIDEAKEVNHFIREEEKSVGHSRTIVVGDFNMDPFSRGLTSANGFNAVMTRSVAQRVSRTILGRVHPFFFNPMWSHFNDGTTKPGGTFYYSPSGYKSLYWHMLDQVLIRPELISKFEASSLRILDVYSGGSLTNASGRPKISDHLPIIFRMNL
jgi:exonuclease III